jgi:hypothetical protein
MIPYNDTLKSIDRRTTCGKTQAPTIGCELIGDTQQIFEAPASLRISSVIIAIAIAI